MLYLDLVMARPEIFDVRDILLVQGVNLLPLRRVSLRLTMRPGVSSLVGLKHNLLGNIGLTF